MTRRECCMGRWPQKLTDLLARKSGLMDDVEDEIE
jgi:hypothetical protein